MNHPLAIELDLRDARRLIVAGDVHGHLALLDEALARVGYDASAGDRLVLLGDLLDRGPDTLEVAAWLDANPTAIHLLGNHDDMLAATAGAAPMDDWANPFNLLRNGGRWICDHAPGFRDDHRGLLNALMAADEDPAWRATLVGPEVAALARRLTASPVAATVRTPGGRTVGLVHADVPERDWTQLVADLNSPSPRLAREAAIAAIWERHLFDAAKRASAWGDPDPADFTVSGVEHVLMGHSITREPLTVGNCSFIDTGSYKHGLVTAIDVDAWLGSAS